MIKNFLEISNLSKSYFDNGEEIRILRNMNLTLADNQIVSLLGPSGSGKSTLLHLLSLLDKPDSGTILFNNQNISQINDDQRTIYRRNSISIVYQNNNLISDLSALENVAIANICKTNDIKNAYRLAANILKDFGLKKRINHYPYQLSGGEQQRVAIARAVINDPLLIFADEPTGNLDQKNSDLILNFLMKLKKTNRLILIATHNRVLADKTDLRLTLSNGNVNVE
ncbi:MAG: ABC transporter ATP-binding protein [Proteobacteria bacterium]|jgi:ABC-type lipoprotein export system ATPase subunit|nr:ABC transporter ATP-binding protein [Pseudomonadota bacterium]MDA0971176.1 ABC transporter ATP-binding protein [Pseudomonadota bacterium]MDA0995423.1 ABC transporter ATP-binding protein [Pseudomonadota bacterium]